MVQKNQKYNSKNIKILEGLEAVRVRPGMYIGSTGKKGLHHMIYEILDNSVDEHLAGYCSEISLVLNKDGSCSVEDNGRGVPVDMHEKGVSAARIVFTTLHAGGKFDNASYKSSGGLHGVGSSVVNALSSWMDVEISRDGKVHHDRYEKGNPVVKLEKGLLPTLKNTKSTGTKITFLPDDEIFETVKFSSDEIKSHIHETAYLNPNLIIHFRDEREDEPEEVTFHEPDGLIGFIRDINKESNAIHEPILFKGTQDNIEVECCIQFTDNFREEVLGFCNNIYNSEGGTHITGFKSAFTSVMNSYAREIGVLKDKDPNFTGADIRNGMSAIVSIKHPDPRFEGQTKTKLDNPDANKAVSQVTTEQIQLFFDRNLETLKAVLACAEKAAKLRKAEEKTKENMLTKKKFSFDSNGQVSNCISKDASKNEIFIVEGNSAAGSAKMGRDRNFQAVMGIRGKILNVEKASINKVLANEEIKTMINTFGCGFSEGYGMDFDISKLKYDKIIIMTDADVDGSHIDTLLLTFFYRFMPDLINEGHIYMANPPLYKIMPAKKNSEPVYCYNDKELAEYRKKHKGAAFTMQRYKGLGEMDPEQLWETTLNPVTRLLKKVNIEDAKYASELTETLMGTNVANRKAYIHKHAREANIDV